MRDSLYSTAAPPLPVGRLRGDTFHHGADPQYESSRSLFEEAAEVYDRLARKLARLAERMQR